MNIISSRSAAGSDVFFLFPYINNLLHFDMNRDTLIKRLK